MKANVKNKAAVKMTSSVIVGYDYNEATDNAVLIVGRKLPDNVVDIVNAFSGVEAKELWAKLTTAKGATSEH